MDDLMADELRTNQDSTESSRREVLLDTAQDHLRDRQPEKSIAIWQQLISEGGEDVDDARLDYADFLFGQLRDDEAWTELAAIMAGGRTLSTAWMCAAELIEERGELATALAWYSLATDSLTSEDVTTLAGLFGAARLVAGRRRVKWALGIPLDDLDLLGDMGDTEAEDKDAITLLSSPWVLNGRILVWDRSELDTARQLWPYRIATKSADEYYRQVELDLREEGGRITVVPLNLDGWRKCLTALHLVRSRDDLGQVATTAGGSFGRLRGISPAGVAQAPSTRSAVGRMPREREDRAVTTGFETRTRGAQRGPAAAQNLRRLLPTPPARLRRARGRGPGMPQQWWH